MFEPKELTVTNRVALVIVWLYEGGTPTTREVARRYGLTRQGAWQLLSRISSSLPIYQENGKWQLIRTESSGV